MSIDELVNALLLSAEGVLTANFRAGSSWVRDVVPLDEETPPPPPLLAVESGGGGIEAASRLLT